MAFQWTKLFSIDSVFGRYTEGKFSTSNSQVSEQIHWNVHSHLSCSVSSSSSLSVSSVSKRFSFAEFFGAKLGLPQISVIKSLNQGAKEN